MSARIRIPLSEDELAEILEALHELRDPFGTPPTPLEERLLSEQRRLEQHNRERIER